MYYVNSICESFLSSWRNQEEEEGEEESSEFPERNSGVPNPGRGEEQRREQAVEPGRRFQTLVPWHSGPGLAFPFGGTCRRGKAPTIAESE